MIQQEYREFKATVKKCISETVSAEYEFIQRRKVNGNPSKGKASKAAKARAAAARERTEAVNTILVQRAVTRATQSRNRAKAKERKERYCKAAK